MSRKRRVFDIDLPDDPLGSGGIDHPALSVSQCIPIKLLSVL
ncbi:MAG: hypothetical protein ACI9TZ_003172 [Yoonia sp.]|jgi:hypothetical protein